MSEVFTKEEFEAIGRHLVENGCWLRSGDPEDEESYSVLGIKLPYKADLSSNGSRVDAVLKQLSGGSNE